MIPSLGERAFELLAETEVGGCLTEFGVHQGGSLESFAEYARRHLGMVPPLFGFDTFAGMPPTDQPLEHVFADMWAEGTFSDTSVEAVQERLQGLPVTLVPATFSDLQPLREYGVDKVALAHIDADLYEGYRDALRLLEPHVQIGTVMLFDESVPPTAAGHQSVRLHGQKAVREWEASTGLNVHTIRSEWTVALGVIVDDAYLRDHWRLLDRLRADKPREAFRKCVRRVLGRPIESRPGYAATTTGV